MSRHGTYEGLVSSRFDNATIAGKLIEYADHLRDQGATGFRERAYRNAATNILALNDTLIDIFSHGGLSGLIALPGIGKGIAGAITELLVTGRWTQLERLNGELSPERLFQGIPGIGPVLATRLADEYHLETLQELEAIVHNPAIHIKGFGPRRREAIQAVLSQRLKHPVAAGAQLGAPAPPIKLILDVDELYREKAAAGTLRRIAPRRFNAENKAWLPVMHVTRGQWHFTALFSNTARAHEFGKTGDWVIIYYQAEGQPEGRCTVVTETHGKRTGVRVVRGHEAETPTVYAL